MAYPIPPCGGDVLRPLPRPAALNELPCVGLRGGSGLANLLGTVFGKALKGAVGRAPAAIPSGGGNLRPGRACAPETGDSRGVHDRSWPTQLLPLGPGVA